MALFELVSSLTMNACLLHIHIKSEELQQCIQMKVIECGFLWGDFGSDVCVQTWYQVTLFEGGECNMKIKNETSLFFCMLFIYEALVRLEQKNIDGLA